MDSTIKQHAGAALVAVGIFAAALAEGSFEPTAYAAASIVIWAAVIAGLVGRVLPATPIATAAAAAGICLAGIVLLAGASVAWASDQGRAFDEAVRASAYLGLFTLAACTASGTGRRQWISGLAAGLGAVSVLALLSHLQPDLLDGAELDGLIPGAAGRLSYPIGYWNGLAALLAVAAILLAYEGTHAPARWLRSVASALMPLVLLGIWLTSSRGGAAAVVLGLVVLIAASGDRPRQILTIAIGTTAGAVLILVGEQMDGLDGVVDAARRADGDRMSALALALALLAGAAAWLLDAREPRLRISRGVAVALAALAGIATIGAIVAVDPAERLEEFKRPPDTFGVTVAGQAGPGQAGQDFNSSGRWQFWGEAVDAFESAPVAGIGAGAYEDWWAQNGSVAVFVRNPHSLPLQQAAELGLLGAVLLLGFLVAVAVAAGRRLTAGLEGDGGVLVAVLATAGLCAAIDWTWAIPAAIAPAVVAAALLTASGPGRVLARHAFWVGLGTVAVAWIAMVAGGLVVLTELKLDASRDAAAEGRVETGVERALEARTVQPWSPEPYTQLALLEELRGDLDQALVRLGQAEARDSEDWRLPLIESRLQRRRGNELEARLAFERAKALNPLSPILGARD